MSHLAHLEDMLRDTSAAIAQYEKEIARDRAPSIAAGLRSLQKRLEMLEKDFLEAAAARGMDVCSYRLFSDVVTRPSVAAVFGTVGDFQELFSTVYDAIKNGPRKKQVASPETYDESAFHFGYTFSGSVGVVLTFDNRQALIETALDQSMKAILELASADTVDDVLLSSQTLGTPALRAMHKWAKEHVEYALGADIQWMRGDQVLSGLRMEVPQLAHLASIMEEAGTPIEETIEISGRLVGTETLSAPRRVHFERDDGLPDIRCGFSPDVISDENPVPVPSRCLATFRHTYREIISTGERRNESYYLVALKPI